MLKSTRCGETCCKNNICYCKTVIEEQKYSFKFLVFKVPTGLECDFLRVYKRLDSI